jgi:hypothetical protein
MKPHKTEIRKLLQRRLPWTEDRKAYNKEVYKAEDFGPVWDFVEDNEET